MKRIRRQRGFTLVEIMIVVAIIALLAAIAIPNVLRGRATANETASIGNVRALISSLEMYRSVYQVYPDLAGSWGTEMYNPVPAYGPPSFSATNLTNVKVQGFLYTYLPVSTSQYILRAVPFTVGSTGTRTMWGTESGQVLHCSGGSTATTITTQVTIDQQPLACP